MARAGDGGERSSKRKRKHILSKRVDDGELAAFKSRAREAGFDDHRAYLSALILGAEGFEQQDRTALIRALGELGKHGSNLNQIAHGINAGKVSALSASDIDLIRSARASVEDVASQIKEILT
jgi:mobilization protein NikA